MTRQRGHDLHNSDRETNDLKDLVSVGVSDKETEEDSETTHGNSNSVVKERIISVLSMADQLGLHIKLQASTHVPVNDDVYP